MINWGAWVTHRKGEQRWGISRKTGIVYLHVARTTDGLHILYETDAEGDVIPARTQHFDTAAELNEATKSL